MGPEDGSRTHARFNQELAAMKQKLTELARLAEDAMEASIRAFFHPDPGLAREVITGDTAVNRLEEEIDGDCVRLIALFQPVASDLRQVMAVDHIIAELERIGDSATNIAEEVLTLEQTPGRALNPLFPKMAEDVQDMVRRSLQAFLDLDSRAARQVCIDDGEVDAMDRTIIQDLLQEMARDPESIVPGQSHINIVRNLERVGDHATNIAEQVVYMVEGESVKHRCQG